MKPRVAQLSPQPVGRDVDRRVGAPRERQRERPSRRDDARELVEERDHVREDDELEIAVGNASADGVTDLEGDAALELGGDSFRLASWIIAGLTSMPTIPDASG